MSDSSNFCAHLFLEVSKYIQLVEPGTQNMLERLYILFGWGMPLDKLENGAGERDSFA